MTNLEMQGLLVVSELELMLKAGQSLPTDVVLSMENFRKVEVLTYGKMNLNVKNMIEELHKQFGDINKN